MLCHMYIYKADVSMFCVSVCLGRRWRGGGKGGKGKKNGIQFDMNDNNP